MTMIMLKKGMEFLQLNSKKFINPIELQRIHTLEPVYNKNVI